MNRIKQTITSIILVTVFSAFAMSAHATSCTYIGSFLSCSNGFGGSQIGDTFYGNDGSTIYSIGMGDLLVK